MWNSPTMQTTNVTQNASKRRLGFILLLLIFGVITTALVLRLQRREAKFLELTEIRVDQGTTSDFETVFIADLWDSDKLEVWGVQHDEVWHSFVWNYENGASHGRIPPDSLKRLVMHPYECASLPYSFYNRIQSDLKAWRYLRESRGADAVRRAANNFTSTKNLGARIIMKKVTREGTKDINFCAKHADTWTMT